MISQSFDVLNMRIVRAPKPAYVIKDFFTTHNGSWEPGGQYGIEQWARDAYIANFPQAGGDHHLFGRVENGAEWPVDGLGIEFTAPGLEPVYRQPEASGWANIPIYSNYYPDQAMGPWAWKPMGGPADQIVGGGLPANNHVSFFCVWKVVEQRAEPVTVEGAVAGDYLEIERQGNTIRRNPEAALWRAIKGAGMVANCNEFTVSVGKEIYHYQGAYDGDGNTWVFYVPFGRWDEVMQMRIKIAL